MECSRYKGKEEDNTERSTRDRGRPTESESDITQYTRDMDEVGVGNAKENNMAGPVQKGATPTLVPTTKCPVSKSECLFGAVELLAVSTDKGKGGF